MAATTTSSTTQNFCHDFLEFQDTLKSLRRIDDNIIHALNTTIPTDSFSTKSSAPTMCKDLYTQLKNSYSQREQAIKKCILITTDEVNALKSARVSDQDNLDLLKKLRKEQTKLRLMQNELNVEEVVKDRSLKVFYERCRHFYKPADLKV